MERFDFSKKLLLHPDRISDIKNGKRPFPVTMEIDLTDVCNHKCAFCFTPRQDKKDQKMLGTARTLRLLDEMWELGVRGISFTGGGESTLHPDFKTIVKYAKSKGFDLGLMTNGSTLKAISDVVYCFQWIRISMAGGNKELYNRVQGVNHFDLVVGNIKSLCREKSSKLTVGVRMLVNKNNINSVADMIGTFRGTGLSYIQFAPSQFAIKDITRGRKFRRIVRRTFCDVPIQLQGYEIGQNKDYAFKCYAHHFQGAINPRGDVLFCKNCRNSNKFRIGNINESSLEEIWNGDVVKELERTIRPNNCGLFCKNSKLNTTMQDILYPDQTIQPNFVN